MKTLTLFATLIALFAIQPVMAKDAVVGRYRLNGGPDAAAELLLHEDGRFEYALAEGALDEHAAGRWVRRGETIVLTTSPKPVPPAFSAAPRGAPAPDAPTLRVTWPNGRGIAGVRFRIGFDSGDPVADYTQEYGWTLSPDEHRIPRWIELFEPIYRIVSPRYPIDSGAGPLNFMITPNDIGVVDFDGAIVDLLPGGLLLHRTEGEMKFVRERD